MFYCSCGTIMYPRLTNPSRHPSSFVLSQTHVLVFTDPEAEYHAPAIATATKIATQFRGHAQVISIEATDDSILQHFKVDKGSLPSLVVMDVDLMERFPFDAGIYVYNSLTGCPFYTVCVYICSYSISETYLPRW